MKLVIAEKPSVAQSIARVIGAAGRKAGYLEENGYLVSWCVGHLVELSAPETYDERYSKWRLEDLPILPDSWLYQISSGIKKQFGILKELMKRPDVESLICATDAGREGELLASGDFNHFGDADEILDQMRSLTGGGHAHVFLRRTIKSRSALYPV